MSDNKKWIIGTFIATFAIALTIFGFWLDGYRSSKKECDDLAFEFNTKVGMYQSLNTESQSMEGDSKIWKNKIRDTTKKLNKANNYFNALEAESVVANLNQIIFDAKTAANNDYNATFFSKPTHRGKNIGDIWYDYLKKSGFPSNPTETKKMVRILLRMGLEEGAGNQIAMGLPASEYAIKHVSEQLKVLKGKLELVRNDNYSAKFQGVSNSTKLIIPIETELKNMKRKLEETNNTLRERRLKIKQISSGLEAICIKSQETSCKLTEFPSFSCK